MIEINDKSQCTGCGACAQACSLKAINMKYDNEGFLFPVTDLNKCINCNKCNSVCHMKNTIQNEKIYLNNPEVYAAYLKKTKYLNQVSSGGAFFALFTTVILNGGIVYGVTQKSLFDVKHERASSFKQCLYFRRSKYLESNINDTYIKVEKDLKNNKTVLFSGVGCQIAGLYGYLKKDYDNLYTCDLVCHGVPSIKVFKKYVSELEKYYKSKIKKICFRDKKYGWKSNHISLYLENHKCISVPSNKFLFHAGYLMGLYNRNSCGKCKYAKLPRIADITLADFWKYYGKLNLNNENKGISLVMCSTQKGNELFNKSKDKLEYDKSIINNAVRSSRQLTKSPIENKNRSKFFYNLDNYNLCKLIELYGTNFS